MNLQKLREQTQIILTDVLEKSVLVLKKILKSNYQVNVQYVIQPMENFQSQVFISPITLGAFYTRFSFARIVSNVLW